ncbi:streptophobe family protein [Streptomyces sp. NPDC047022]|uniref:streptophobe family protein n=1 Tax=Streptomyces sp. NPDC047022 TaxID=3155737 RepID=UPI0033C20B33
MAEGAGAALCAVAVMTVVSGLGLYLLGAGSYGSLWSLTSAVTSLSVGGSARAGSDAPSAQDGFSLGGLFGAGGGGGLNLSVSGAADLVPLGVTLAGSVTLWFVFSRGLSLRRVTGGDLAARGLSAAVTALIAFAFLAHGAHGTVRIPGAVLSGAGHGTGTASGGGLGSGAGGLGGLFGGANGGGQAVRKLEAAYQVSAGAAVGGAVLWVAVVVALGCLISRRVPWPGGSATGRLRNAWAPSVSAAVRVLLVTTAVALAGMAVVGVMVGGRASMAAGAALLLAPNAVAVFLTLGLGVPWTASKHHVSGEGGGGLAALISRLRGQQSGVAADRTEHLGELSVGGVPLWLVALAVAVLVLVVCGYVAARATDPARTRPLHPYGGRHGRHLAAAERLGVVTAVVMGAAALFAQASGHLDVSVFDTTVGGTRAELGGGIWLCPVTGLLAGAVAGLAGSSLYCAVTGRFLILGAGTRAAAGAGGPLAPDSGRKAKSGSVEEPVGNR